MVEVVPELRHHGELVPGAEPGLNGLRNALANLLLVAVVHGPVEKTVASLNGVVDLLRGRLARQFPAAKADLRDRNAVVQFRGHYTVQLYSLQRKE